MLIVTCVLNIFFRGAINPMTDPWDERIKLNEKMQVNIPFYMDPMGINELMNPGVTCWFIT